MDRENPFKKSRVDNFGITEFSDSSSFDLQDIFHDAEDNGDELIMTTMSTNVQFLNIDDNTVVYKYQSRVRKEAKQRLKNAVVEILVTTCHQIMTANAWIQREEKAAELFGYDIGRVPFSQRDIIHKGVRYLDKKSVNEHVYSIDLDAIYYDAADTRKPVYKLAKTDMQNRNRFQLVIQLVFIDGSVTQDFVSPAFYCCTQPKQNVKRKSRTARDFDHEYSKDWYEHELHRNNHVVELLQANKAVIGNLVVKSCFSGPKKKADIAYHFNVQPSEFRENLEEGDIVGLNEKYGGGEVSMSKLTSWNIRRVLQVGVISRSAFFEGNTPNDESTCTDKICVLGMVNVKIIGHINAGERVYASVHHPGKAISESHRSRHSREDILLGIAMESPIESDFEMEHLVQCFVSIIFGISSSYFFDKAKELETITEFKIDKAIDKIWKKLWQSFASILIVLGLIISLICFIFVPGSP